MDNFRMLDRLIDEGWKLYHSIKAGNDYKWEKYNLEFIMDMLDGEDIDVEILLKWEEVL